MPINRPDPLRVLITVDTEIWCDGWDDLDSKFPRAYERYIYGTTRRGVFGLPFMLKTLRNYGLKATFFVEPLFSLRFGFEHLQEIVSLIHRNGQQVELHLHTEWIDEAKSPRLPAVLHKQEHLKYFSTADQVSILRVGKELLQQAGVSKVNAFRAGGFGANDDTLTALSRVGIGVDSSYNQSAPACAMTAKGIGDFHLNAGTVREIPMTNFLDGTNRYRQASITASSFSEMTSALQAAHRQGWNQMVILTHPFELLNRPQTRPNSIVVRRFVKLCQFLAEHSADYLTTDFADARLTAGPTGENDLRCPFTPTLVRLAEQAVSRLQ